MTTPERFETATETYQRKESLGEGGSGRVFKVTDSGGDAFALKLLKPELRSRSKEKRFKNEIAFLRQTKHEHIVPVVDFGLANIEGSEAVPFFVMPFFPSTLRKLMGTSKPMGIRDPINALKLFDGLLSGVEAAHQSGVIHRDLKPENVLFDERLSRLVVTDFGIARFSEAASLATFVKTAEGERLASWRYAAPEQKKIGASVDTRADIYSLGLILAEMFTGEVPEGASPIRIASVVPSQAYLDEIVESLRQTRPEDRPASIRDVKGMLLAKGNDFVALQKVRQLDKAVVPASSVDDPLVNDPPGLLSVRIDEGEGGGGLGIVFKLSRGVTPKWLKVLQESPIGYSMNYPPSIFTFAGDQARCRLLYPTEAQHVIDHFKSWLEQMKVHYRRYVEEEERRRSENERASLVAAKQRAEQVRALNQSLRI